MHIPKIPYPPLDIDSKISEWMRITRAELISFIDDIENTSVDRKLVGDAIVQSVGSDFTIDPVAPIVRLSATAPVSSSVTTAVKAGHTARYQSLVLVNIGANNITIINDALVKLRGAANKILGTDDSILLVWDGVIWRQASYESDN